MPKFAYVTAVPIAQLSQAERAAKRIASPAVLDCSLRPVPVGSAILVPSGDLGPLKGSEVVGGEADIVSVGVYVTPDEFVTIAATKSYPGDSAEYLPSDVRDCIEALVKENATETMMHRLRQIVFIKSLVRECSHEQLKLEESMNAGCQNSHGWQARRSHPQAPSDAGSS